MKKAKNLSSQLYDLWEEGTPQKSPEEFKTKTLQRKQKSRHHRSTKYVPSLLPPVVVPNEGASYNPPLLDSYLKFVNKVANSESKIDAREQRLNRRVEPNETEQYSLKGLREDNLILMGKESKVAEEEDGKTEPEDNEEQMEMEGAEKNMTPSKRAKTMKERRRNKLLAQKKLALNSAEQKKLQKQQLNNLKSLNRTVKAELAEHETKLRDRRIKRTVKNLTKRKRLGRGKFEPYQEPVLTPLELPYSLRQLPSTGDCILHERLKSLQQRNIVPVPGERQTTKLKSRLRAKFVEKRSVKEVTTSSRVI